AYKEVREAVHELTLEASPVGALVRDFAQQQGSWDGTASDLLTTLEKMAQHDPGKAGTDITKQKAWPKNGRVLSNVLRRLASTLRAIGVNVTFDRGPDQKRQRIIRLAHSTAQAAHTHQTPGAEHASDERERTIF